MFVRLYINTELNKVQMAETDQLPIKRPPVAIVMLDPVTGEPTGEKVPLAIVSFELEDLTDGNLPLITSREFAEDIADGDNEARFGESIVRVKDDLTIELSNEKAAKNKGNIKTCRGLRIKNYEVIDYGT